MQTEAKVCIPPFVSAATNGPDLPFNLPGVAAVRPVIAAIRAQRSILRT